MSYFEETVLEVEHYDDSLFRFKTTRSRSFKFNSGEFAMIGLHNKELGKDIFRAYSLVSTPYDDHLEFLSIKVENGPLTSILQTIEVGTKIMVRPKTTGSLVVDYLYPKKNLVLLATGTGIAPFISIVNDFKTYERFENVYLFHTTRKKSELAYKKELLELEKEMPLVYTDTVTREDHTRTGRFWDYIVSVLGSDFNSSRDGIMVCGSKRLNTKCRFNFKTMGWQEGNTGVMGDFLLERAFVD